MLKRIEHPVAREIIRRQPGLGKKTAANFVVWQGIMCGRPYTLSNGVVLFRGKTDSGTICWMLEGEKKDIASYDDCDRYSRESRIKRLGTVYNKGKRQ